MFTLSRLGRVSLKSWQALRFVHWIDNAQGHGPNHRYIFGFDFRDGQGQGVLWPVQGPFREAKLRNARFFVFL